MRRLLLLLALCAAACRREAPASVQAAATIDAPPPVGEAVVPAPVVAVGDVQTTREELVAAGTVRLYRDGKWRGNGHVLFATEVEARREVLAVDAGRASRLRVEYPRYRSTVKVGAEERDVAPRLAGRSFIADLAGGLSVVAGDGEAVGSEELAVLRREIEGLTRWAPVQGRTLVLGQAIAAGNGRFMLKDRRGQTAVIAARVGLEDDVVIDGEALLDLATGRVTRFTGDGTMKLTTGKGRRGGEELVGETRVRYVWELRRSP